MPEAIVVALVAGLSTGIPGTLAALAALRKASAAASNTRPNGQGTLTAMAERQLVMLGEVKGTLEAHVTDPAAHRRSED